MTENAYVVIFPSTFSQNKTKYLLSNIKNILKIQGQKFSELKKDGPLIILKANDPVFASSAINLLFGIKQVSIAKQVKNELKEIVKTITEVGTNLLLKGEKFYVKVEGQSKGFLPKDIELAATSSIIEKTSHIQIKPGTEENHDKLLYTYLTNSHAYVSIFSDVGLGGIPNNSQENSAMCCIFDELSAVSCLETIKQGFRPELLVCYKKKNELTHLVKIVNQILPRFVQSKIEIKFLHIPIVKSNLLYYIRIIGQILINQAKSKKIKHVSLPVSNLVFPLDFVDQCILDIYKADLIPINPLSGLDENIFQSAKEIGLGKFLPRIEKLSKMQFSKNKISTREMQELVKKSQNHIQILTIKVGPNNVHDILDSLEH